MTMNHELMELAFQSIHNAFPQASPKAGLICGSGWSQVADVFTTHGSMHYEDIPGLGRPGVEGHSGTLLLASLHGVETLVFQGRRHYYESGQWTPVALPIYVLKKMGVRQLVLTNAAGCINNAFHPGDLMVVTDHINCIGSHPLIGPHDPTWGPRFPDQTNVYHPEMVRVLLDAGNAAGASMREGVYLAASGPTYETPAEIRMYRTLGADAVGMSTVPEAALANAAGIKVGALSCMTNYAAGISGHALSHEEVTDTTRRTMPLMLNTIAHAWKGMASL